MAYFNDINLLQALADYEAGKNIRPGYWQTTGSGENMSSDYIAPSRDEFTYVPGGFTTSNLANVPDGQNYRVQKTSNGYAVSGNFDIGPKGLRGRDFYDANGNYLYSDTFSRDSGWKDVMIAGSIAAAPFAVAGLQGMAAGAGAAGTTAGMAGVPASVIPEGVAFAPATAAEMGAMGLGGAGAATTAGMAGVGASVIPEGAAFAPATSAEMGAMGLGGAGMSMPSWLGPAASIAGGLLGSQGTQQTATSSRDLPAYLQAPVTDLVGRTQGLLGEQMAPAYAAGAQMIRQGQGLLSAPVAGNGVGQVKLNAPTTPTNPYLSGLADDIGRRTAEMLGQNNLSIQGNAVAAGGLGGSRQGVAQGVAAGKAADYLSGQLAGLYGNAYNSDQNRSLQQYQADQGFYTAQRGQDLTQQGIGAGLIGQGFQNQFAPLQSAASVYGPFSGFGNTTTNQSQGGGAMGALGGALGVAQLGKLSGWWG